MVIHPEPGSHGLHDMWELFDAMAVSVYMRLSVHLDIHVGFVVQHTAVVCNFRGNHFVCSSITRRLTAKCVTEQVALRWSVQL